MSRPYMEMAPKKWPPWTLPIVITSVALTLRVVVININIGVIPSDATLRSLFSVTDGDGSKTTAYHRPKMPRFAYLVSGSSGDLEQLWRLLRVLYHQRNQYVVHLDRESPESERLELGKRVEGDPVFTASGERARSDTGRPRHLPWPNHGVSYPPWPSVFAEEVARLGLVHQSKCLRLSTGHPRRLARCVLRIAKKSQLRRSYQRLGVESGVQGKTQSNRSCSIRSNQVGSCLVGASQKGAHGFQALRWER